jgi:hypothetical protein
MYKPPQSWRVEAAQTGGDAAGPNDSGAAMSLVRMPSKILKGLSFSVGDLVLLQARSEARSVRMVVRLDHGSDVEEYEEVLAFHSGASQVCRWIMWRNADSVFVQPLIGRRQEYNSAAEAIEALLPMVPIRLTDIDAGRWPHSSAR